MLPPNERFKDVLYLLAELLVLSAPVDNPNVKLCELEALRLGKNSPYAISLSFSEEFIFKI